ncbi:hypothetical protein ILUMI_21017 [Ignelater luminosus]|uniref:Reverse transcriptase domain-containing protein n=1 Tax=Ignelater luminosus TaxID=2038154 RepID=A0A8K0CGD1_IGNLU|nr:hypothetical protein ILUMI_21017 [Ignelater luminosus]
MGKRCKEIDKYIGGRRSTESWKFIKSVRKKGHQKTQIEIIPTKEYKNYFAKILNEDRKEVHRRWRVIIDESILQTTISELKNKRAARAEAMPNELIKNGTNKLNKIIKNLFERCINGENIPDECNEKWTTPIHKKEPPYGRTLTKLIQNNYLMYQTEEQADFREGQLPIDNVFCLTQAIERIVAVDGEIHIVFIDLTTAYDNIPIQKNRYLLIWKLQNLGTKLKIDTVGKADEEMRKTRKNRTEFLQLSIQRTEYQTFKSPSKQQIRKKLVVDTKYAKRCAKTKVLPDATVKVTGPLEFHQAKPLIMTERSKRPDRPEGPRSPEGPTDPYGLIGPRDPNGLIDPKGRKVQEA